jgi:hypothetical protein
VFKTPLRSWAPIQMPTLEPASLQRVCRQLKEAVERLQQVATAPADTTVITGTASGVIGPYANNAAAVAAGIPVGQLYRTATGEVRIVV